MRKSIHVTLWAIGLVLVVLGIVGLVGCGMPGLPGNSSTKGSISVRLASQGAKSILPPGDLVCAEYLVSGTGPGGAVVAEQLVSGTTVIGGLVPGPWTINAVGRNSAHTALGAGSATATVTIGQTTPCAVTVVEYGSPDGTLQLNLSWEPDIVANPAWTGMLQDTLGVQTPQDFTMDAIACTAASTATLHPGWFSDIVQLFDQPGDPSTRVLSGGFAEAVRIAAGQQTTGTITVHAVQGYGSIDVSFGSAMNDPLTLTPTPAFGAANIYNVPVTFSITSNPAANFIWYLRGQVVGTGSTFTLSPVGLNLTEVYRLDVLGFDSSGAHGGSGTWQVTKSPGTADMVMGSVTDHSGVDMDFILFRVDGNSALNQYVHVPAALGPNFNYAFTAVPSGQYWLMYQPVSGNNRYWNHFGTGDGTRASADILTINNPTGLPWICNW